MQKTRRGGSIRVLVTLSALSAIGIILGKFLAFNVTEFMRFSLENITIIFSGILFGPLYGAAVGAVQDIVGCIAVGFTINPIITLGSAAVGAVSGATFRIAKKLPQAPKILLSVILAHIVGSVLIKSIGLTIYYQLPFVATLLWRILNYVIVGSLEAVSLITLLKSKQLLAQINKIVSFPTDKFESLNDATSYARSVSGVFSKPGLKRVQTLLAAVGSPEKNIRVVHVTGTNGKGSFIAMLSSILSRSGLRVGSFTSPYLEKMSESIRFNGKPISEGELVLLLERLRPIADGMNDKPTEFELLTAAAFLALYEANVDIAIIECGMGAKQDATNVINAPILSVITGISKDHTAYLGETEKEIAEEKSGVIKKGCPVLIGDVDGEALEVILKHADELDTNVTPRDDYSVKSMLLEGSVISCSGIEEIRLPLLGIHQPKNASLAISAAKLLQSQFPTVTDKSIKLGISETEWHGRFEILKKDPLFIFDGAHNLDGITSAVESIKAYFDTKVICITGVLRDKEYDKMAEQIATVAAYTVTVTPSNTRALSAEEYAGVFTSFGIISTPKKTVTDAVEYALQLAKENNLPVICLGSLYLYNDVSKAVKSAQT